MGEARSDFDIALGIIKRLDARGISEARRFFPWESKRAFNEFLLGDGPISMAELLETGYASFPYELGNFDKAGFRTGTGKLELYSERLACRDGAGAAARLRTAHRRYGRGEDSGGLPVDPAHRRERKRPYHHSGFATKAGRERYRTILGAD